MLSTLDLAKKISIRHNVSIRVLDENGQVISEHTGHNAATNSMITGVAHYLTGDGVLNQGYHMLSQYVPQYISLGTMGLINQDEDADGLPAGVGAISYKDTCDDPDIEEIYRFIDYITQAPGYGADGYDVNQNNNRTFLGLGPKFEDRGEGLPIESEIIQKGDVNFDGKVDLADLLFLVDYDCGRLGRNLSQKEIIAGDIDGDGVIGHSDIAKIRDYIEGKISLSELGTAEYVSKNLPVINCELISDSFPRSMISFRDIVPEYESEFPQTVDVVFSAMISTGALAAFREPDRDYIFITECGLWSRPDHVEGGDNGLLAGYRIVPPNTNNWKMAEWNPDTQKYFDSDECKQNRRILKENIIRVGRNQIVQVIWKVQLGGMDQLGSLLSLYPHYSTSLRWMFWE